MLEISSCILIFCGNCNKLVTNAPLLTPVSFSAPRLKIYTSFPSHGLFFILLIIYGGFCEALLTSNVFLWAKTTQDLVSRPSSVCSAVSVFSETPAWNKLGSLHSPPWGFYPLVSHVPASRKLVFLRLTFVCCLCLPVYSLSPFLSLSFPLFPPCFLLPPQFLSPSLPFFLPFFLFERLLYSYIY